MSFLSKHLLPVLIYLVLASAFYWAVFPVGTYDIRGDLWNRGGYMAGVLDEYDHSNDVFLSDKKVYGIFNVLVHVPFYRMVNDWETYISLLNVIYYFLGCVLLYFIIYKLTRTRSLAVILSLLFSSATIWFSTGDLFALIPTYSAVDKTLAYLWYLLILTVFLYSNKSFWATIVITCLSALMIWIHPVSFMGPGLATIVVVYFRFLLKEKKFKAKVYLTISAILVGLFIIAPYAIKFANWGKKPAAEHSLTIKEKFTLSEIYKDWRGKANNPFEFKKLKMDLNLIRGYRIMALLAITLIIISSIFFREREEMWIFSGTATVIFISNLSLRLIEYLWVGKGGITVLYPLIRNDKWLYIFSFLIVITGFSQLKRLLIRPENKIKSVSFNLALVLVLFVCLNCPLPIHSKINTLFNGQFSYKNDQYTYGPVFRSYYHNYVGMKLVEKMGLCDTRTRKDANPWHRFCVVENGLRIMQVNNDVEAMVKVMKQLPDKLTFSGPSWLRYKAHRSMAYATEPDGQLFLITKSKKYFEWQKNDQSYHKIIEILKSKGSVSQALCYMSTLSSRFLFLEKFEIEIMDEPKKLAIHKLEFDLADFPILYENDSFAIVDLKPVKTSQPCYEM